MDDDGQNRRRQQPSRGLASFAKLYERPLPFSLEAEMALLGSMLLDPRVVPDVVGVVTSADDLYAESHRAIYGALVQVYDKVPDADLVAILDALRDRGQLELVGIELLGPAAEPVPLQGLDDRSPFLIRQAGIKNPVIRRLAP